MRVLSPGHVLLALVVVVTSSYAGTDAPQGLSFRYEQGQPMAQADPGVRGHQVKLGPLAGEVYVYATFDALAENPTGYAGAEPKPAKQERTEAAWVMPESYPPPPKEKPAGQPRGRQFLTLGQRTGNEFQPAVRFGIHDGRSLPKQPGTMYTYLDDGRLQYYGLWARPNTAYDFKLKLNLSTQRMTVWMSGRGDDRWYLAAENVPLMKPVKSINEIRAVQYPAAPGIREVVVSATPWPAGEQIRPHPSAKANRVVATGQGFRFQPMRSTWGMPDKHVTICRKERLHYGFPDVARSRSGALLCVFSNQSHTGMQGEGSVCISRDGGRTWSEPVRFPGGGRIQQLKDGPLLCESIVAGVIKGQRPWLGSTDDGKTWTQLFNLDRVKAGSAADESGGPASHLVELADGSWLIETSLTPEGNKPFALTKGEQLEFFRSTDKGKTWKLLSKLQAFPPYSLCESSVVPLPDGRLVAYVREDRTDGFPAIKAFSSDAGKTWKVHELPFAMTGRVCAHLLRDGRMMCTFRSCIGRSALWAWIGQVDDTTPFLASGVHLKDSRTVGLKDGSLHIDNDGVSGQFTRYFLRPPDSPQSKIDVEAEVKVVSNGGMAATLAVPFVGNLRLYPDHIELAHQPAVRVDVTPGEFHTYRVVRDGGKAELHVDGQLKLKTDKGDGALGPQQPWTPAKASAYPLAFGNEPVGRTWFGITTVLPYHVSDGTTGYSLWRRVKYTFTDPVGGQFVGSWSADRDGFPDQYQLDHIVEVEATSAGHDQGYSGWLQFDDGRILVVNYTDDGAPSVQGDSFGIPWIRGTWLDHNDLPPCKTGRKSAPDR
jgi:hypothetical protein